jgi:Family of unknown function (DUF6518)
MSARSARRLAVILLAAFAFGLLSAWIKGNGPGVRDAIGNASAPWLLLPFLAGATAGARSVVVAALAGLAATLAALMGFYLAESFVLQLGQHPWLTDLRLTMSASVFWVGRACLSGPVFGAIGFWWQRRRSLAALGLMAAMFVLEPLAWWVYNQRYLDGGAAYPVPGYPVLWIGEIAIGIAGFIALSRADRQDARLA